jgi:hypothetical protein
VGVLRHRLDLHRLEAALSRMEEEPAVVQGMKTREQFLDYLCDTAGRFLDSEQHAEALIVMQVIAFNLRLYAESLVDETEA